MLLMDAFHEGGWPMYPILLFGILLVGAAAQYAQRPDPRRLLVVQQLRAVTLTSGAVGWLLGVVHSLAGLWGIATELRPWLLARGISECINDLGLALVSVLLAGIITSAGAFRAAQQAR